MVSPADRGYIYKLRKEECLQLLTKLELSKEGNVGTLRVRLFEASKKATPDEIEIFLAGKKSFLESREEDAFIKTWVFTIPEEECQGMLQDFNITVVDSDEQNRYNLEKHLNNAKDKEIWVEYAKGFCEDLDNRPPNLISTRYPPYLPTSAQTFDNGETSKQNVNDFANHGFVDLEMNVPSEQQTCNYRQHHNETIFLMDQVRRWGMNFSGKGGPTAALQFLERMKDRATRYEIPEEKWHVIFPALLTDEAENWYQSTKGEWNCWAECENNFKLFFLPAKMREEMADEVRSYLQRNGQPIKEFILQLKARMRFVPNMDSVEQLERIYKNLHVDYQMHIKRAEFKSLEELIRLGEDFEEKLQKQHTVTTANSNFRGGQNSRQITSSKGQSQTNYALQSEESLDQRKDTNQGTVQKKSNPFRDNPGSSDYHNELDKSSGKKFVCYNCDRSGHTARFCRAPFRPWCKNCKKRGITTADCGCQRENAPLNICARCRLPGHTERECPPSTSENHSTSSVMTYGLGSLGMSKDRRPRKEVEIAGKSFTAVLDTGATTSYINALVREHLKNNTVESTTVKVTTRLANGLDTSTDEVFHIDIRMDGDTVCQNLLVLPGMREDAIIGIDALEKFGYELVKKNEIKKTICVKEKERREQLDLIDWQSWELCGNEVIKVIQRNEKLEDIFPTEECCGSAESYVQLTEDQHKKLKATLDTEFKKFENIKECTHLVEHRIKMKNDNPIRLRYYPKNPKMRKVIYDQVDDLLERGLIETSASSYCSPIVLVKKKDGTWRMCVDYRKINENSERDAYPIPHIPNTLSRLKKAKFVSALDLKNGYWQIPINAESRQYTAFVVPGRGLFQWRVMPFGLHSAPATFQRFLDLLITQKYEDFAVAYLDDIIVFSESFDDHLFHLETILSRLADANLKINEEKSSFCKPSLKYLGHIVGGGGIRTDPDKVKAIEELPAPTDISGVRRIIGMAGWYSSFIPNFTETVAPLNELLGKNKAFHWGEKQEKALRELKSRMKSAPILSCPDYSKQFFLQTDASNVGLGAVLFQREGEIEKVITFRSRSLQTHEKNYTTTEKECLAVLWAIQRNAEYLEGIPFTVITDHLALKWIFQLPNPTGRLGRWALELRNHDFTVEYRKGKENVVPDALSRHPIPWEEVDEQLCASTSTEEIRCEWLERQKEIVVANPQKYPEFSMESGQLLKNCGTGELDESNWKLCVAQHLRKRVLEENHTEVTAGHLGIRKTLNRIRRKYFWPGMKRDVIKFINRCRPCLEHKASQQKPAGLMYTTQPSCPWDIITMDYIGPFPRSTHRNQHVLVIQDKFTKWVECIPQRKATAAGLTKAVRERILCRFGWPRVAITDNGSQFVSRIFKGFLKQNGINHQLTPPYSAQCNSTERINRVVKTMVKIYLKDNHRKWDDNLPEIQFAVNSAFQESTGFSPSELNFGRQLRTANSLFDEKLPSHREQAVATPELSGNIKEMCALAKRQMEVASQQQSKYYNLRRRSWSPKVGEKVYRKNHYLSNAANAFAAKLAPSYSGPFWVANYISPTVVELRGESNPKKLIRAHVKDLKELSVQESD